MNLSYWEIKSWFTGVDFTVVGSGIVGLNTALYLKERYPKAKILILEKGILPEGASTKNAGFACFGSLSEILEDLKILPVEQVVALVQKRWEGLQLLRQNLGDKNLDFQMNGGYELFFEEDPLWDACLSNMEAINTMLKPVFNSAVYSLCENRFSFKAVRGNYIFNPFEGQLDTGKMMTVLLRLVQRKGINLLNNCEVESISDGGGSVSIRVKGYEFKTKKLLLATNGFAGQFLKHVDLKPARAQVLITKPLENLHIKGTFHLDRGYYYFRNIDNRILLGGARNLDFKTEETTEFGLTETVQDRLEHLLKDTILPDYDFEIEHRWSGIMAIGKTKQPIVEQVSQNVWCGVRLGGMGVAIGSLTGKELADKV